MYGERRSVRPPMADHSNPNIFKKRKEETRRKINPYRVWFFNGTFYVIGFCHVRKEVRTFALNRIKTLRPTGKQFEIPGDFNFDEFIEPALGSTRGLQSPSRYGSTRMSPDSSRKRSGMKTRRSTAGPMVPSFLKPGLAERTRSNTGS